jgi:glycosyltransferase involved in cell wall biosynthesis
MFTSWEVRCGIAAYSSKLVSALRALDELRVDVVPFDRQAHPRSDYVRWGQAMNSADLAHVQHEYTFFGYLLPWRNHFEAFARQIHRPLVMTRHVSFDGPLHLAGPGWRRILPKAKWALYNRWLGPYAHYLNRGMFDRARHVIVLSQHLKDQLVARGFPAHRISVIPPGIAAVDPVSGTPDLRSAWNWSGKTIVGMFGFISAAKGHSLALEALAQLPGNYVLLIAGGIRRPADEPFRAALLRQIERLGLEGRVRMTGFLPEAEVAPHLSACDLLIYPYTRVDTSYSLSAGLAQPTAPLLLSDVAAHREIVERSAAAALFRSGDSAALAHEISALSQDPARRMELLRNAARYARANDWGTIARRTSEVYTQVLAEARQP